MERDAYSLYYKAYAGGIKNKYHDGTLAKVCGREDTYPLSKGAFLQESGLCVVPACYHIRFPQAQAIHSMSQSHVVCGSRAILEAIAAGKVIDKIFVDKEYKNGDIQPIFQAIRHQIIPCSRVPVAKLMKLAPKNHQGIVALLSPVPFASLGNIVQSTFEKGEVPLIILLDGVTDVGNLGAIIRTAVCVGAHALVIPKQGSASLGSGAMKTSAGALAYLPICRESNLQASINYLQNSGIQVVACHEKTKNSIYQTNLSLPTAILMGSEDQGIQPPLIQRANCQAAIPMSGSIGSLNVSVATAVVLQGAAHGGIVLLLEGPKRELHFIVRVIFTALFLCILQPIAAISIISMMSPILDRKTPPSFQTIPKITFPWPLLTKAEAQAKIPLFVLNQGELPIVKLSLLFEAGSWYESQPGVAYLAAKMLLEGTNKKTAQEIATYMDYYGASIAILPKVDYCSIELVCLSKHFEMMLALLQEVLLLPAFPQPQLSLLQKLKVQALKVEDEKNSHLSRKLFKEALLGKTHPYGYSLSASDVLAVNTEQINSFYKNQFFVGGQAFLSGKITDQHVIALQHLLSLLPQKPMHRPNYPLSILPPSRQHMEKSGSLQSAINIGKVLFSKNHPDYLAMYIVTELLGGYFGSRLMRNIREEKGYTYHIYATLLPAKDMTYFFISTEVIQEFAVQACEEIYKEIRILQTEEVSQEELIVLKNYLIGEFLTSINDPFGMMQRVQEVHLHGMGQEFYDALYTTLQEITPARIKQIANMYLAIDSLTEITEVHCFKVEIVFDSGYVKAYMDQLKIITSTTRPTRRGILVAQWVAHLAKQTGAFQVELLDLAAINLPLLDELHFPAQQEYQHEHTKRWGATIQQADAFIIVLAEYNHGFPAPIKNALDYLFKEWMYKPVSVVSYGDVAGGMRAMQMLKPVLTALHMLILRESVAIPFFEQWITEQGTFEPNPSIIQAAHKMFTALVRYSEASRSAKCIRSRLSSCHLTAATV
eukprot:gene1060-1345_t